MNEREFKGGLYTLLPRLESFVGDGVVTQRPVPVSIFREKTKANYPLLALRELLMNACMHRDYQSNTPIRFYQYEDRIEIMNAGGLYGEARPENFPFVNAYRNPVIAEAMKNMKYVNMFNRGVGSVQEYLKRNGSEPAKFSVDKLTVFEVCLEDANIKEDANLEQFGINLEQLGTNLEEEIAKWNNISRRHIMKLVINPAIELGVVTREYPKSPNHPRQRYLLTPQGAKIYDSILRNC